MSEAEQARAKYAVRCHCPPEKWRIVTGVEKCCWYDFFDLETGEYGQCFMHIDGTWGQAPKGTNPTFLEYQRKASK